MQKLFEQNPGKYLSVSLKYLKNSVSFNCFPAQSDYLDEIYYQGHGYSYLHRRKSSICLAVICRENCFPYLQKFFIRQFMIYWNPQQQNSHVRR